MSQRVGENQTFSEYHDNKNIVAKGIVSNIKYEIHLVRDSHYSLYAQLNGVCPCMIDCRELPILPVDRYINFGPTKDNWIGFTTNARSDYNYDSDWNMLEKDARESPDEHNFIDQEDIKRWTPQILESAFTDWIVKTKSEVDNINFQCNH